MGERSAAVQNASRSPAPSVGAPAFGVRRQSAAATALWIDSPRWAKARPHASHLRRIQSGVALRFPPRSTTRACLPTARLQLLNLQQMRPFGVRRLIALFIPLQFLFSLRPPARRWSGSDLVPVHGA